MKALHKISYRPMCLSVLLCLGISSIGQNPFIPEDPFNLPYASDWKYLENAGQVYDIAGNFRADFRYMSVATNPTLYLMEGARTAMVFGKYFQDRPQEDSLYRIDLQFVGETVGNPEPIIVDAIGSHYNFYEEYTPMGITGVGGGKRVVHENVYPDIDLHHLSNQTGPRMLIVVRPGGDPYDIIMQFEGQDSLGISLSGALKIWFDQEFIELPEGQVYQQNGSTVTLIPWVASYNNANGSTQVTFDIGSYDPGLPLIMDITPLMGLPPSAPAGNNPEWGTYIAGPNEDGITALDHDDNGYTYFTGFSRSANDLPITSGAYQEPHAGSNDIIIGRLNEFYEINPPPPQNDTWMTYLGNGLSQQGHGISYDPVHDRVAICADNWGGGSMPNFVLSTNPSCFQGSGQGIVAFFNGSGLGGSTVGELEYLTNFQPYTTLIDVDHDADGNLFVVGHGDVQSSALVDPSGSQDYFSYGPLMSGTGVFGTYEAVVAKFSHQADLEWATILGGHEAEWVGGCHVDPLMGRLYVVGQTGSPHFPLEPTCGTLGQNDGFPMCNAGGWYQNGLNGPANVYQGQSDGFITAFSLNDLSMVWSSFWGGYGSDDMVTDVTTNTAGDVYITGYSNTLVYNPLQCAWNNTQNGFPNCSAGNNGYHQLEGMENDSFIARFSTSTELTWSTLLGGSGGDGAVLGLGQLGFNPRVACDENENVFILAPTETGSSAYPGGDPITLSLPMDYYGQDEHANATTAIAQRTDLFIGGFDPFDQLMLGTYFGGNGNELAGGLTAHNGRVFLGGRTTSTQSFPLHCPNIPGEDPYCDATSGGNGDGFLAQIQYDLTIGIDESSVHSSGELVIYPNPASETIIVSCPHGCSGSDIALYDGLGRMVLVERAVRSEHLMDVSGFSEGIYLLSVVDQWGMRHTERLLIE